MKKKSIILFLLTICMLSTGCYQMKKDINDNTNIKINVNVNSVDQGIIQGRYVCQNENMLAYRDGAGIYLSKDGNEAKKVAVISGLEGISVNSKYVFYLRKDGGIYAIDNNEKDIIKDTTGWGSENIDKPIELLDDINTSEVFNSIGDNIYVYKGDYEDLKVWEIGTGEVKEVEGFEYKNKYVLNDENNTYPELFMEQFSN